MKYISYVDSVDSGICGDILDSGYSGICGYVGHMAYSVDNK